MVAKKCQPGRYVYAEGRGGGGGGGGGGGPYTVVGIRFSPITTHKSFVPCQALNPKSSVMLWQGRAKFH